MLFQSAVDWASKEKTMEQIKIFLIGGKSSDSAADRVTGLMEAVNAWLRDHHDKVIQRNVTQDGAGAPVITFFYRSE